MEKFGKTDLPFSTAAMAAQILIKIATLMLVNCIVRCQFRFWRKIVNEMSCIAQSNVPLTLEMFLKVGRWHMKLSTFFLCLGNEVGPTKPNSLTTAVLLWTTYEQSHKHLSQTPLSPLIALPSAWGQWAWVVSCVFKIRKKVLCLL